MLEASNNDELPPIPVSAISPLVKSVTLCGVKPHVLRYWEQEFPQLKPVKRPRQPALLSAPGCPDDPSDQEPAV